MSPEKAFVLITARNEGERIAYVIDAAQNADPEFVNVDHIIVINNGSTDDTRQRAFDCGAKVIDHPQKGKGYGMNTGVQYILDSNLGSSPKAAVFLDADLRGLRGTHVNVLARPILCDEANMVIGFLGERPEILKWKLRNWGALSGQRGIRLVDDSRDTRLINVWGRLRPSDLKGSRTEGAENALLRNLRLGYTIPKIELTGVSHVGKREKESNLFRATAAYTRTYGSAIIGLSSRAGK